MARYFTNYLNDGFNQNGKQPHPPLITFGNPLLDITLVVKNTLIHEKFNLPVDGQLEVTPEQKPLFDLVLERDDVSLSPGGCALNTSRVFSWVFGEPNNVVFVGGIGMDDEATKLKAMIDESNIITRYIEVEDKPTGMCAALVLGAQRCLSADIGAAAVCRPDHVFSGAILPLLEDARVVYLEGYFLTHSFDTALKIAEFTKAHNKILAFNLCGSYVCEKFTRQINAILPYVHILFGYIEEYCKLETCTDIAKLCAQQSSDGASIVHTLRQVFDEMPLKEDSSLSVVENQQLNGHREDATKCIYDDLPLLATVAREKVVVVTQGPKPLVYTCGNRVLRKPVTPIHQSEMVDTTGAGDSFVGGFLAALLKEGSLEKALDCGMWTAQQLLRQKGCSIPAHKSEFLLD